MNFKAFLLETEEKNIDVKAMLKKLPLKHQSLLKGYKFKYLPSNTLKKSDDHVGVVDEDKKIITIAAPWNYGRQFTTLHEIGHLVWQYGMKEKEKNNWKKIAKKTKRKQRLGVEELFCMAYANHYADHKDVIHTHDTWDEFIKGIK